jgi:hypothetical protein
MADKPKCPHCEATAVVWSVFIGNKILDDHGVAHPLNDVVTFYCESCHEEWVGSQSDIDFYIAENLWRHNAESGGHIGNND